MHLISQSFYNINDFGAVHDGETLNTKAINEAIGACAKNGGGTVYIPSGRYMTGAILLKTIVHLYLEAGAYLLFSNDVNEYPVVVFRWEGVKREG